MCLNEAVSSQLYLDGVYDRLVLERDLPTVMKSGINSRFRTAIKYDPHV